MTNIETWRLWRDARVSYAHLPEAEHLVCDCGRNLRKVNWRIISEEGSGLVGGFCSEKCASAALARLRTFTDVTATNGDTPSPRTWTADEIVDLIKASLVAYVAPPNCTTAEPWPLREKPEQH